MQHCKASSIVEKQLIELYQTTTQVQRDKPHLVGSSCLSSLCKYKLQLKKIDCCFTVNANSNKIPSYLR